MVGFPYCSFTGNGGNGWVLLFLDLPILDQTGHDRFGRWRFLDAVASSLGKAWGVFPGRRPTRAVADMFFNKFVAFFEMIHCR